MPVKNIFSKHLSIPISPTLDHVTSTNSVHGSPQMNGGCLDCFLDHILFFSSRCKKSKTVPVEKSLTTIISLSTECCNATSINKVSGHTKTKKNKDFHGEHIRNSTGSLVRTSSNECNVSGEHFSGDHATVVKDCREIKFPAVRSEGSSSNALNITPQSDEEFDSQGLNNCKLLQTYIDSRTKKVATISVGVNLVDNLEDDTIQSSASFTSFELPISPYLNKHSRKMQQTNHRALSRLKFKDDMTVDILKNKYVELKAQFEFIGKEPLQIFLEEHRNDKSLIEAVHKMLLMDHCLDRVVKEKMRKEMALVLKSINQAERQMQIQQTFATYSELFQPDQNFANILEKFLQFKEDLAKQDPSIILNKHEEIKCLANTEISVEQLRQLRINKSLSVRPMVVTHAIVEKITLDMCGADGQINCVSALEYMINRVAVKCYDDELKVFIKFVAGHKQTNISREDWIASLENFYKLQMGMTLPAMFYKAITWFCQAKQTVNKIHAEEWMYELVESNNYMDNCIFKELESFCENHLIHARYIMLIIDFVRYQLNNCKILLNISNIRDNILSKLNTYSQNIEEKSMILFTRPKLERPCATNELLEDASLHNQFDCYQCKV